MILSEIGHGLLTQLADSREQILTRCKDKKIDLLELYNVANMEACSALVLMPVPVDPIKHLIEAHKQARSYLEQFINQSSVTFVKSGLGYEFTPRKTLRRILDHALDHLNQIEQWLVWQQNGIVPQPTDGWAGSALTLDEDTLPLTTSDLDSWLWRIDLVIELIIQRVSQLNEEQLYWKPPDDGWTLWKMLHHLASGETLYSVWFGEILPEEPVARYVEANQRLFDRAEQAIKEPLTEGRGFIDDELGLFTPDKVILDTLQLERGLILV